MKIITHKELSDRIASGTCFCSRVRLSINGNPYYASCTSLQGSGLTRVNYYTDLPFSSSGRELECYIKNFDEMKKAIFVDIEVQKIMEDVRGY